MQKSKFWLIVAGIGIVNAVLLRVFELAVNNGTNWLWNDVFGTDTQRWKVVPLAIGLSVGLTALVQWLGAPRLVPPETDFTHDMRVGPVSLRSIGLILLIGLACLVAGASLGPEAALMAASAAIGAWIAARRGLDDDHSLLVLASVGALLVAFLGSIVMVAVPLILLFKQRRFYPRPVIAVLVAGLVSSGMIQLIDHAHPGFGTAPPLPHLQSHDYGVALLAGFATTAVALGLQWGIRGLAIVGRVINGRGIWPLTAGLFGLILGLLYLWGGQTIQFSGSGGSHMLVANRAAYGIAGLAGLVLTKLLATAWSKATGYRGGLVFPSIYMGVALGLFLGRLGGGEWGGAGAVIGGIAGMMSAMTPSPIIAAVFMLAILPGDMVLVALVAIGGSAAGNMLLRPLAPRSITEPAANPKPEPEPESAPTPTTSAETRPSPPATPTEPPGPGPGPVDTTASNLTAPLAAD
jgi:H+/Cl- antiporter ClcA